MPVASRQVGTSEKCLFIELLYYCILLTAVMPLFFIFIYQQQRPLFGFLKQRSISASVLKTIIAGALKHLAVTTALAADSVSKDVDTLFYALQPLICVFAETSTNVLSSSSTSEDGTTNESGTNIDISTLLCHYLIELVILLYVHCF